MRTRPSSAGRPVKDWDAKAKPADLAKYTFRLRLDYDEAGDGVTFGDKLAELLETDSSAQIAALVVGSWTPDDTETGSADMVERLVSARDRLPNLRHLFLGDITGEECEISWIRQSDMSPLLAAYEQLETFVVRGGEGLSFGTLRHDKLRELTVQTGGLPPAVIHEIAAAELPSLEKLELWLGEPNYGGDATVDDLAPILRGDRFPKLKYLGLKDSVIQDEIAAAVSLAPVAAKLQTLDLSMGNLGDAGATALLASPAVRKLKRLDLHHHYMSDDVMAKVKGLPIDVDVSDQEDANAEPDDRYIAVSE